MQQIDFEADFLEFSDRFGIIRKTWGYSLVGRAEFWQRLAKLGEALEAEGVTLSNPTGAIARLYESKPWFRHNCDRCLQLNGIDPDWLDGKGVMLSGLLFQHGNEAGLLVQLNQADPSEGRSSGEPGTMNDAIAALWQLEGGFELAWKVADSYPAKIVDRAIAARAKQSKPPEQKEADDFSAWTKKASGMEQFKPQSTERN